MKPYTDITVLLDRSGSMSSIKGAMEEAFDAFVTGHKETPSTRLTLVEFDSPNGWNNPLVNAPQAQYPYLNAQDQIMDLHVVYENWPICEVPKLQLLPRGGTPLIDAMVRTIDLTGQRLAKLHRSERPEGVIFMTITDGAENMSRQFTRAIVRQRVETQKEQFQWQFLYLGANQDAIAEAASYGIQQQYAINYVASEKGTGNVMRAATVNTVSYTNSVAGGATSAQSAPLLNITEQQRSEAAE